MNNNKIIKDKNTYFKKSLHIFKLLYTFFLLTIFEFNI